MSEYKQMIIEAAIRALIGAVIVVAVNKTYDAISKKCSK